jgi:hypothetical protein
MSNEVKLYRTMQGVDVIGFDNGQSENSYKVSKALFLQMYQDKQSGEVHISFVPVSETFIGNFKGEDRYLDIDLSFSAVMFTYEPNPQLADQYQQAVSGIQIAKALPPSKL